MYLEEDSILNPPLKCWHARRTVAVSSFTAGSEGEHYGQGGPVAANELGDLPPRTVQSGADLDRVHGGAGEDNPFTSLPHFTGVPTPLPLSLFPSAQTPPCAREVPGPRP